MNFNKVFLGGNLTRDVELRHTQSGTTVAKFGVATNETYTSNGEKKQRTTFVDVTAFGKTAEVINEHLGKGDPIFIEGRLDFSSWEAQDGTKRSKLAVIADRFQFCGRRHAHADADEKSQRSEPDYGDIPF